MPSLTSLRIFYQRETPRDSFSKALNARDQRGLAGIFYGLSLDEMEGFDDKRSNELGDQREATLLTFRQDEGCNLAAWPCDTQEEADLIALRVETYDRGVGEYALKYCSSTMILFEITKRHRILKVLVAIANSEQMAHIKRRSAMFQCQIGNRTA